MELTDELKSLLIDKAKRLKGSARRQFMARTVKALGPGGASRVERECGWNRKTIRKGMRRPSIAASRVWMRFAPEAANSQKNSCPACCWISEPSSMGKAKRIRNSQRSACTRA
jgi:hypothetical protein